MTIIPIENLALSLILPLGVLLIFIKWKLDWKSLMIAITRMLIQLMALGYFLNFLFNQDNPLSTSLMILFMIIVSSWISLNSIKFQRKKYYKNAIISLFLGALPVLLFVVIIIIPTSPWYTPRFIIPLAGMVFASSMNAIGIGVERFLSEIKTKSLDVSRRNSLKAALIPQINMYLAVGLVSLPGMMTGQILSGIDPLIAVRYQIVVMTMLFGASALSVSLFLYQQKT